MPPTRTCPWRRFFAGLEIGDVGVRCITSATSKSRNLIRTRGDCRQVQARRWSTASGGDDGGGIFKPPFSSRCRADGYGAAEAP